MKKVFISYSHKDKDWVRDWLLPRLEKAGVSTHIDFRDFEIGVASVVNMERAVEKCAKTLLVLTQHWIDSEYTQFEGIMVQTEDPIGLKKRILPLKLDGCELPRRLQILTYADFSDKNNWDFQIERVVNQIKRDFGEIEEPAIEYTPLAEENIDITRLPQTGHELFGRQKELGILNEAWESEGTNVLSFVAYGGVGKSTLVNKWLEKMRWDNYRGTERVYAWSFYSQGTGRRVTSADIFVSEALNWFGDEEMAKSGKLPWDKGKRLAELIQNHKTLLILDGLEPLQSDYEHDKGAIKDPALEVLLKQLVKANTGLCVITTRELLTGISKDKKYFLQKNLEQISPEAGRALLHFNGIRGADSELEQATRDFGCHALAINLLIAYLQDTDDRQIKNAALIPNLDISEEDGKHPRRIMQVLADRLGPSPELNILHIMGLFDRPVSAKEINWLRTREEVPDLTDRIRWITDDDWNRVITNLRHFRLIAPESHHNRGGLDAHPHVREHFGQQLKKTNKESWKQGHSHLYEFLKMSAPRLPDTLAEMEPLFAAVNHGCQAGRYQRTLDDVYYKRIKRGREHYNVNKLGTFSADLATVACFFEKPWSKPVSGLTEKGHAFVLICAGYSLRALGRLREAAEPMHAALEDHTGHENWRESANDVINLSELYLIMGQGRKVVDLARDGIKYADDSQDSFRCYVITAVLADALHQLGKSSEAKELFEKAEEMQKDYQPHYHYLYSVQGFNFCDLLLSQGEYNGVQKRARQTLKWVQEWALDILYSALDKLSLGRSYLLESVSKVKCKKGNSSEWKVESASLHKAGGFLNEAVEGLRESGQQYFLPRGLLARAELNRYKLDFDKAWIELEEAKEIAERGQMNLYMADYHLEAARLCLAEGKREEEALGHYEESRKRVDDMGYHRRDPEVLLIQAELEINEGDKKRACETLEKAKKLIDEMGCHRWHSEFERLKKLL